uniref:Uncharacterized protein n=2 Tax=Cyclophora tenuis TaxID=216820 RepID=A0A7S1GJD6_CYCTE|mmetsp:Transcript_20086/g.34306  ORF Transcript_20086/g.34306 Transcript_20086/m.34306 type:complete len:151 (+) Transcript_20086:209-661(+)
MNNDKFNTKYHNWTDDHFTVCQDFGNHKWSYFAPKSAAVDPKVAMKEPYEGITHDHAGFDLFHPSSEWRPCLILESFPDVNVLDVVALAFGDTEETLHLRFIKRIHNLPPDRIRFINKPFRSDMFSPGSFRHAIMIPNDMFPVQWRDLVQ